MISCFLTSIVHDVSWKCYHLFSSWDKTHKSLPLWIAWCIGWQFNHGPEESGFFGLGPTIPD